MSLKDRLEIILITYNRAEFVKRTFEQFFFEGSPVADVDFIVQDNNSDDNTEEVVKEFAKLHSNIKYVKNKYNLGLSGTIARAMERAGKDYVWIIGDDDLYDFSNWKEVEDAINNNEKMICHAKYAIPEGEENNPAYQLFQLTFITGGIYSTSLFDDITIRNAYDNIYTLFPHIPPIIKLLNDGGKIYVTQKAISDNGMSQNTDCSFTRGISKCEELYDRN
jgi:glycosyltransferase involved in cell wall biosynthesis